MAIFCRRNIIRVWMKNIGIIIGVKEGSGSASHTWDGTHGKA